MAVVDISREEYLAVFAARRVFYVTDAKMWNHTIAFTSSGLDLVPGAGVCATVVCMERVPSVNGAAASMLRVKICNTANLHVTDDNILEGGTIRWYRLASDLDEYVASRFEVFDIKDVFGPMDNDETSGNKGTDEQ